MSTERENLYIFIFPLMAAGHLLPAVDIAKLLASRGVKVSVITTAGNSSTVKESIRLLPEAAMNILLVERSSPFTHLPDYLSSELPPDGQMDVAMSASSFRPSLESLVIEHRPDAIISDTFFPWTADLGIPRLVFHGTNFFSHCLSSILSPTTLADESETFLVPGIPHRIELRRSQLPDPKKIRRDLADLFKEAKEAEEKSYGTVVNSFYELEPEYADYYRTAMKRKAWHVGPVSLVNESGREWSKDWESLSSWLDSKAASSVLYVCFGSLSRFTETQIKEIARGLNSCGCSFIWAAGREAQWLPEDFKEGIIVRRWAPQVLILGHRSVGGFLTHCGWNSSMESICSGVPVATWPMFAEQFYNERFLVDVLRVGVEVGAKTFGLREEERDVVKAEKIAEAVGRLMGDDTEAAERRERARELKAAAWLAFEEGGSSRRDLDRLIEELIASKKSECGRPPQTRV